MRVASFYIFFGIRQSRDTRLPAASVLSLGYAHFMHTFACKNTILIEQIGNSRTRRPARAVMFDFDGTVALVRAGWMPVMLDMMMETLAPLGSDRTALCAE